MRSGNVLKIIASSASRLDDDAKLSFAAATACCFVGAIGWFVNYVSPGSTMLGALTVVGCFYLLAGTASVISRGSKQSLVSASASGDRDASPLVDEDRRAA